MSTPLCTALEDSYDHATKVVADIGTDQLALPTPCAQWDVRATLEHLIGATWMFTLVNQGQAVGEDDRGTGDDDPVVVALTDAAGAAVASWRAPGAFDGDRTYPFGTFPADAAAMMNLSEVIVHTWDIATALGADAAIDPAVAEMLYRFYRPMSLDPYRAHGAFGAEVVVDTDAPPAERLLALLGRRFA
jgi:uncharacterized protein (TIGR03086 family)